MKKKSTTAQVRIHRKKFLQPVIWKGNDGKWYYSIHRFENSKELFRVSDGNGHTKISHCKHVIGSIESPHMLPFLEIKAGKIYYDGQVVEFPQELKGLYKLIVGKTSKKKKK